MKISKVYTTSNKTNVSIVGAYHGADVAHRLEYLHLSAGLTKVGPVSPRCLLGPVHRHHVGAPEGGQVVHRHQVLLALVTHYVQVTYQSSQSIVVYSWEFIQ